MKILEVRDSFIKLETSEKIALSSFYEINDKGKKYIAQAIQSKKTGDNFISFAKILYLYDGTFNNYDGTIPSKDSKISEFSFDIVNQSFKAESTIKIGNFIKDNIPVSIEKDSFNRKMLISLDNPETTNKLLTGLASEFLTNNKILVIDMLGLVDSSAKFRATIDFKIPLNSESLEFIYEDCLNDATSDSKTLVKEIFSDLAEYSKEITFLPFKTLKTIIDDMVEKSHIFKLLVLKNKLAKFDSAGYFAATIDETRTLEKKLNEKSAVIDLSKLDSSFQNRYLSVIYNILVKSNYSGQIFVLASNAINKKNIKTILQTPQISATFITHSRFKYLAEFKSLFTNYLLENSFNNNEIFKTYSMFLNNMDKNNLLLVGDSTNFIPTVISLENNGNFSPFDEIINIEDNTAEEINEQNLNLALEKSENIDPHSLAIEKKSQDFAEKLAEEQNNDSNIITTLFEEDLVEEVEENIELEEELEKEEEEEKKESFSNETEFHTNVDSFHASEIQEEISEEIEEPSITEETISYQEESALEETPELIIENFENTENEIPSIKNNENEVIENEQLEEIEVPEEILELEEGLIDNNDTEEVMEEAYASSENNDLNEAIEESIDNYIETEVIPIDNDTSDFEEIIELDDDSNSTEEAIIIDMETPEEEALNREIKEDVDKVFTTIKDDSLTESDLDFIDELNNEEVIEEDSFQNIEDEILIEPADEEIVLNGNDTEELENYSEEIEDDNLIEPIEEYSTENFEEEESLKDILETKAASTPMVPVYNAEIPQEDLVMSDPIEQGDTVNHAKYGTGIVEKMIKYGNKTLYSINFDNVGRRLLDPTLTEIKKS